MRASETFHFPMSFYESFELDESRSFEFTENLEQEYNRVRQQTYRYNRVAKSKGSEKRFKLEKDGNSIAIIREK